MTLAPTEFVETSADCRECLKAVTSRQQALKCDSWLHWVHRLCGTGLSQVQYREIMRSVKAGGDFSWLCPTCSANGQDQRKDEEQQKDPGPPAH